MRQTDDSWKNELTRRGTPRKRRKRVLTLPSNAEFILSRVEPDTNGGCWLWCGTIGAGGYGDSSRGRAHRLSYETFRGEIPEGALVCHACDVRLCVNPDHLWIGTHKDNSDDMMRKKRGAWESRKPEHLSRWHNGDFNPSSKLNSTLAREIRQMSGSASEIAKIYGVSKSTVNRIWAGSIWKE